MLIISANDSSFIYIEGVLCVVYMFNLNFYTSRTSNFSPCSVYNYTHKAHKSQFCIREVFTTKWSWPMALCMARLPPAKMHDLLIPYTQSPARTLRSPAYKLYGLLAIPRTKCQIYILYYYYYYYYYCCCCCVVVKSACRALILDIQVLALYLKPTFTLHMHIKRAFHNVMF